MPRAPKRPCPYPGCNALVDSGRCEKHKIQDRRQIDERRGSAHARGYTAQWRKYRLMYLQEHPLCVSCNAHGTIKTASEIDHIRPHKGDMKLFWDPLNHQGLCKSCHSAKTSREDGGFSNKHGLS
jgi:5-methylcytosine-specific restriction enzyme A